MPYWNYIVIGLSIALLAYMVWKEWNRANRRRLYIRLVAVVLAVISFACLILPITRTVSVTDEKGKEAVLLTDGFNEDSVTRFIQEHYKIPVYYADAEIAEKVGKYKAQDIESAEWIRKKDGYKNIHVFGYGLREDAFIELQLPSVIFHSNAVQDGIHSIHWQKRIKSGDQLFVQGTFQNTFGDDIRLVLNGPDTMLDEEKIPSHRTTGFTLTVVPKHIGKVVYSIVALNGKDTVEKESLPFEVEEAPWMKVLALSATPDFENKFLVQWLAQNSYALASRVTISKDKYEQDFLNTSERSLHTITPSLLNDFDVLVADAGALAAMSGAELNAVETQVSQRGMGLVVKWDSTAGRKAFYSRQFPVIPGGSAKAIPVQLPLQQQSFNLVTEQPVYISPQPGTQAVIQSAQANAVVSSTVYGAGRIVFSTVNTTYSWMLSGAKEVYQNFWTEVLDKAKAGVMADQGVEVMDAFPVVQEPVEIKYLSNDVEVPSVLAEGNFISMMQDADLLFQWKGKWWPRKSGWQRIDAGRKEYWSYVYEQGSWKVVKAAERMEAMRKNSTHNGLASSELKHQRLVQVPVNKIYFILLFLMCMGVLWVEKKIV